MSSPHILKRLYAVPLLFIITSALLAKTSDKIVFGNAASERKHNFSAVSAETCNGAMDRKARRMLPLAEPQWKGGSMTFTMKVEGKAQNYFTVENWGGDADDTHIMLFIEGRQIGYRHLGDYDLLHRGNGGKPCPGKFYYTTLPLPRKYTDGRTSVSLEIRSYGNTWDYGGSFDKYQMPMKSPTIAFYQAFVHTDNYTDVIAPQKSVRHSEGPIRHDDVAEVLSEVKDVLCKRVSRLLSKTTRLGQQEVWMLADAYSIPWTPAYKNDVVLTQVAKGIDDFCDLYDSNNNIIMSDGSVYNSDWMTTCLLARSVRTLWNTPFHQSITPERRARWTAIFKASLDYSTTHRRQYTNQSMIIDMCIYEVNRTLALLSPDDALPEYQTLHFLYEALGMTPWLGSLDNDGQQVRSMGDNYWQLTAKGLTKELGFVGYYGEVADWVNHIYEATCTPGVPNSGDMKIRSQVLTISNARYPFRYESVDDDGYRCMRAEAVVGWRDGCHYPGDITYGDRGTAWDSSPLLTAYVTRDSTAVGIALRCIADGQLANMIRIKLKESGNIRAMQSCLHLPEQYEWIVGQQSTGLVLPMTHDSQDYVFADPEDGVVAVKHGEDILYASLYWRARNSINRLVKIHHITPTTEHIANLFCTDVQYSTSGLTFKRPDYTNLCFTGTREWYGVEGSSAHAGDEEPIGIIPEGVQFKLGQESPYAGKADLYYMEYGPYTIIMNSSRSEKTKTTRVGNITIQPLSTTIFYNRQLICENF